MVILIGRMAFKLAFWQNFIVFIGNLLSLGSPSFRFIVLCIGRISFKFTANLKLSLGLELFPFLSWRSNISLVI